LELEDKVRARTEELYVQNQELVRVRQETEMELDMAKQVQQGMLPKVLPRLTGYEVAAAYAPTGKVSGDFYDFIRLDEDHIFMLMTDVSGHGVPAALVTAMAKMAFDRHVKSGLSVAQILTNVNIDLCAAINTDHYLTAFAGVLELKTGRLAYSRVCHPYPVIYRHKSGSLEHLQMRGGFFLGMFEDNSYAEQETILNPGDLIFVYTDGINESFNSKDELYGRKRLDDVIRKFAPMGPTETINQAQVDKERFSEGRQSLDDISIFAIKRLEKGG
jgi:phosphoserine phosphatase RsbU/P